MELEQMLAGAMPARSTTIDAYMTEPGLYSGMPSAPAGYEPLTIRPLESGTQLHVHNDAAGGGLKQGNTPVSPPLDAYQTAMADHYADALGYDRIDRICREKNR